MLWRGSAIVLMLTLCGLSGNFGVLLAAEESDANEAVLEVSESESEPSESLSEGTTVVNDVSVTDSATSSTLEVSPESTQATSSEMVNVADTLQTESQALVPIAIADTLVITDLAAPIVVQVSMPAPVIVESPGLIEQVIDTVQDFFSDTVVAPNTHEEVAPQSSELEMAPEAHESSDTPPREVQGMNWLWRIVAQLVSPVFAETSTTTAEEVATTTHSTDVSPITDVRSTSTASDTGETPVSSERIATTSTSQDDSLPWLRFASTSEPIDGTLEPTDDALVWQITIPAGTLPLGIHDVVIATTTPAGTLFERIVVDVGGGARAIVLTDTASAVVVSTPETDTLWLVWSTGSSTSFEHIATSPEFKKDTPMAFLDQTLFYLTSQDDSLVGYQIESRTRFSVSFRAGETLRVALPSGVYLVAPNDIDMQFVSVPGAVY